MTLDIVKIKELYDSKQSLTSIGKCFGCSKSTIRRFLVKYGVKIRTAGETQRITDGDKDIAKDYIDGINVRELSCKYIHKMSQIYKILRRNNIVINRKKEIDDSIDKNLILEVYAEYKNLTKVSDIMNISSATVHKWLKRNNIEIIDNHPSGENHWHWKGGITPHIESRRKSAEYLLWRKKVYARDNFRCCICESKKEIHAHHIIAIYNDENKIIDLDNGITLCRNCHEKTHSREDEFIDYFKSFIAGKILDENKFKTYFMGKVVIQPVLCRCGCGQYTRIVENKPRKYIHGHSSLGRKLIRKIPAIKTVFTDEIVNKIKLLYESGKSAIKISEELNVSSTGIRNIVKSLGIARSLSQAQYLRFRKVI